MKVLVLGYSSIAQRRMIPALRRIDAVTRIDVASRTREPGSDTPGTIFSDYAEALRQSAAELVYVSLSNAAHAKWVLAALESGRHVIVDKPAVLTLADARVCLDIAARRNLVLAEATVFSFHPQIAAMRAFFRQYGPLTHIDARFIIPPLPSANFRNHSAQGGGCLLDMGPYAAAVARLFGDGLPQRLAVVAAPRAPGLDIDVGFSLLAQFNDGVRYSGHFGFEGEYQNELLLVGKGGSIAVERVFSPPPDFTSVWQQRCASHASREEQAPADVFELFAASVIAAITTGDHHAFSGDLLRDAELRARIADCLAMES